MSNSNDAMFAIAGIMQDYIYEDKYWYHELCVKCKFNRGCQEYCSKILSQYQLAKDKERNTDNFECSQFKRRKAKV